MDPLRGGCFLVWFVFVHLFFWLDRKHEQYTLISWGWCIPNLSATPTCHFLSETATFYSAAHLLKTFRANMVGSDARSSIQLLQGSSKARRSGLRRHGNVQGATFFGGQSLDICAKAQQQTSVNRLWRLGFGKGLPWGIAMGTGRFT